MSLEIYAFLPTQVLPSRAAWQATIDRRGYPVQLDVALDLSNASGYSPCVIDGESSGFELLVEPAADVVAAYLHLAPRVGASVWAVSFKWSGDSAECACAMAATAGLAAWGGALVYYPPDDLWYQGDELRTEFDACRRG